MTLRSWGNGTERTTEERDMREKLVRLGLVAMLAVPAATGIACDKEDRQDVEEAGNEVEKEVDQLDSDGKDD